MRLSVIVPTYNRAHSLKKLLDSLNGTELPQSAPVELIVVNNGSTDQTAELLRSETLNPQRFSLQALEEQKQGKANALNLGLAAAAGDILLVLDDDVIADSWLLAKHMECYRATEFDAVQGRILPGVDPYGKPADLSRLREYNIPIIDYGHNYREISGLTGTNMSFKREVFEAVGRFNARLGPGAAGFSEDTEYSIRIRNAGFRIGYTPDAVVYHELNPKRYGRAYNRTVEYRKGMSRSLYRHESIIFRVLPNLAANCLRYGLYRTLGMTQKAYKTEGRILKTWGYLRGKISGAKPIGSDKT